MTTALPLVSVVIVNYNGLRFLPGCLGSLAHTTYPELEILLVDNASTDRSVAFVEENYPQVRIIRSEINRSYAGGNNLGIRAAHGKYIVLLNNDTEVVPGWLEPLVDELEQDPEVAACQPKILQLTHKDTFEYAGGSGGFMDRYGFPFLRGRVFYSLEKDQGQYDDATDIFWASGAALAIRKDALDEVGLLDEDFVLHMEEIDLCWRLQLHGYRLRVRPDATVHHYGGGTLGHEKYAKMYHNHRNSVFILLKNYDFGRLLAVLPVRWTLDLILILKSLVTLDLKRATAVVAAHCWLLVHPGLILRKRRQVQRLRKVPDTAACRQLYPGSLVLAYYIKGKRTFRDIWPDK